jgi:CHAD domain-containing protein
VTKGSPGFPQLWNVRDLYDEAVAKRTLRFVAEDHFELPEFHGRGLPPRTFTETYFDTGGGRLGRAGFTLRRRVENGKSIWQLAVTSGHGASSLEVEAPGGPATPPDELQELLVAASGGFPLAPVARLRARTRGVRIKEGRHSLARVELASIAVLDGNRVARTFSELEVEPLAGNRKQLARIKQALREAGARKSDERPRLARAVETEEHEELPAPTAALEQLRTSFREQYARILAHDPGVRLGDDPEEVHQLRVAARRMRSVLRTAAPLLERSWVDDLREELSWLGGELGPARDFDVLHDHIRSEAAELDATDRRALEPLLEKLAQEGENARRRALEALRSDRYFGLLAKLEGAAAAPAPGDKNGSLVSAAKAEFGRLEKAMKKLADAPSKENIHRVRIKGKRARYAAELVEDELGKAGGRLIASAKRFQDVAGEHQDAVVAEERIRALVRNQRSQRAALAAGLLVGRQRERRDRAVAALPGAWSRLEKAATKAWA